MSFRQLIKRALLSVVIVIGLWLFASWFFMPRFESTAWKASNGRDKVRVRMIDDLLSRYELAGMTRDLIHDLLGPPQDTAYFREFEYVYLLGLERSFVGIDSEWLCLSFRDDVVTKAIVMSD